MQKHTKIYYSHFDYGEQDFIPCECCLSGAVDIHHVHGRGKGKDVIENLMAMCRKHHKMAHDEKLSEGELQLIHNSFMLGHRKIFVK